MAKFKQTEWELNAIYDMKHSRQYINGEHMVLHCHHFTTLYTQLALDADDMMDSVRHLQDTARESFYETIQSYFAKHEGLVFAEKVNLIEQLYSVSGLGKMEIVCAGNYGGEIVLHSSHVDAGWIKKWGQHDVPVNHITVGFIAAAFSVLFDKDINTFVVNEYESIVCGAEKSKFVVARA